ncbi:MAG TPA: hypothetical protein VGG64_07980 [Pirellulales bacterium]|jgi:hypothetical protein
MHSLAFKTTRQGKAQFACWLALAGIPMRIPPLLLLYWPLLALCYRVRYIHDVAAADRQRIAGIPKERKWAWSTAATLFLDDDYTNELGRISQSLAALPFSPQQLTAIFYDEVAPVVWWNLLSVAGECFGWNEEWLHARVSAVRPGLLHRLPGYRPLARFVMAGMLRDHWRQILEEVDKIRRGAVTGIA